MPNDKSLPPLPSSDEKSISANTFNSYYKYRTREFWGENEVIRETPEPFRKCRHTFIPKAGGVLCEICGFGLNGIFEVKKGKLFHEGRQIGI